MQVTLTLKSFLLKFLKRRRTYANCWKVYRCCKSTVLETPLTCSVLTLYVLCPAPFAAPAHFFQSVPVYQCRVSSSGSEKRKHSTAFPESSTNFMESASGPVNKQQFLAPSTSSDDGPSVASCSSARHIVSGVEVSDAQPVHHSSSVFSPAHYPNAGSTQQAMLPQYNGRKILMCTVDNCYCSSMPSVSGHHGHPSYSRSPSFAWAQEFSHPMPPPAPSMSQPIQNISVRGNWIGTSQSHRHPDFYSLYGEPSTKHYVTS